MARPDGLDGADPGMRLLADAVSREDPAQVLLVHCGDLPGLRPGATRLVLDVREHTGAVQRCVEVGLDRDPLEGSVFSAAVCWPRAHLGLDFSQANLAYAAAHLRLGGVLWCAARRQKGGKRLAECMRDLLGDVDVRARDHGYHLYAAARGETWNDELARALLGREYEISDPRLDGIGLRSVPGVFSRRHLDAGTAMLIDHARARVGGSVARVLDLGCGVGALALWAARRWAKSQVLAVDTNLLAVELARHNAERHALSPRVRVEAHDGLVGLDAREFVAATDLVLCNPPTHASAEDLAQLLAPLSSWLAPEGRALVVVNRAGRATQALHAAGLRVEAFAYPGYQVLEATHAGV